MLVRPDRGECRSIVIRQRVRTGIWRLLKYAAHDRRYEDHHGDQEQSADDHFAHGAAVMLTTRVVFLGSHFIRASAGLCATRHTPR